MFNAIIKTKEGKKVDSHIIIDGIDNWNINESGIRREYKKEIQKANNNPANIERITFNINGIDHTFIKG